MEVSFIGRLHGIETSLIYSRSVRYKRLQSIANCMPSEVFSACSSSWVAVSLMMDAGIRVVSNAGGVNPQACVAALLQAARDQGLELSVATVTGDDFTDRVCISYSLHSYSLLVYTSILILLYRRWRRFRC